MEVFLSKAYCSGEGNGVLVHVMVENNHSVPLFVQLCECERDGWSAESCCSGKGVGTLPSPTQVRV